MTPKTIKVPTCGGFGVESVTIPGPYHSLADMKRANKAKSEREQNGCYFGRAEMRFFDSRPAHSIVAGRFFIDTVQFHGSGGYSAPRVAKVCMVTDSGDVEHVAFPPAGWNGEKRNSTRQDSCLVTALQWTDEFTSVDTARSTLRLFLAR